MINATVQRASHLLALLLLQVSGVQAQSLGDELILSRLGDPVEVEIEVKDWQNIDLSVVQVVNATQQQYEAFGLVYQPLLDTLSFNIVGPNLAGEVKILVSSRDPANEPFLELLLALRWPDGSALREYVLLFDPPLPDPQLSAVEPQQPAVPAAVTEQMAPAVVATRTVLVPVDEPLPAEPKPAEPKPAEPEPVEPAPAAVIPPEPAPISPSAAAEPVVRTVVQTPVAQTLAPPTTVQATTVAELVTESRLPTNSREAAGRKPYRVQNGDTLWTIASQFQPAGIADNMYQFVLSLHDINRAAFIDGNISLLKADADLQIPSARDLAAINPASAQRVFDQRWLDATRAAQRALETIPPQLPAISAIEEEPVSRPLADAQPEPELPLGTELPNPANAGESTLLAPSTAIVLAPAVAESAAAPLAPVVDEHAVSVPPAAEVAAIQVLPQQVVGATTTTESNTQPTLPPTPQAATNALDDEFAEASTALQQITDRATAIRDLLQARQQRLAAVEQQILALKSQLLEAETRAAQLVQGLPQAADVTREAVLLGLLAAVLLIALIATVLTALRWKRELQPRVLMMAVQTRRR